MNGNIIKIPKGLTILLAAFILIFSSRVGMAELDLFEQIKGKDLVKMNIPNTGYIDIFLSDQIQDSQEKNLEESLWKVDVLREEEKVLWNQGLDNLREYLVKTDKMNFEKYTHNLGLTYIPQIEGWEFHAGEKADRKGCLRIDIRMDEAGKILFVEEYQSQN